MNVVITGANSAVGQAILRSSEGPISFVAAVRSERAAKELQPLSDKISRIARISYDDPSSLQAAFQQATAVIHLAGVLVERPDSTYEKANVETTRSVVEAAKKSGVQKFVLISAVGATDKSANRYWRTKGQAEALVRAAGLPYTILRVPILLGRGTEGAAALQRSLKQQRAVFVGGGHNLHQPLLVDDLARAATIAASPGVAANRTLDLVGPTPLKDRDIIKRAASLLGRQVRIWSIPKALVWALLAVRQRLAGPGFSLDALEVITADTKLDPAPAAQELGIRLAGVDDMIRKSIQEG